MRFRVCEPWCPPGCETQHERFHRTTKAMDAFGLGCADPARPHRPHLLASLWTSLLPWGFTSLCLMWPLSPGCSALAWLLWGCSLWWEPWGSPWPPATSPHGWAPPLLQHWPPPSVANWTAQARLQPSACHDPNNLVFSSSCNSCL